MWCRSLVFFFFFFLQFFGRLGELVDQQRYGLCEILESKAKSKGLRNWGRSVMSKLWGSLIASPSSTTSKFPSCRAQAFKCCWSSRFLEQKDDISGFVGFFWSYASVKKAKLHRGVISYARLLWRASWQFGGLASLGVWVRACFLTLILRGPSPKWRKIAFDWKRILFKDGTEEGCKL